MFRLKFIGLLAALFLVPAGFAFAGQARPAQTLCPVTGDKIDKKVFVDYKGQRIYFCCASCIPKFNADPEKYLKKMKEGPSASQAAAPQSAQAPFAPARAGQPQTLCPITGEKIDPAVYTESGGYRVYFCCKDCIGKFQKDPSAYIRKMKEQGIALERSAGKAASGASGNGGDSSKPKP
jgi:YHS domain-containing protein